VVAWQIRAAAERYFTFFGHRYACSPISSKYTNIGGIAERDQHVVQTQAKGDFTQRIQGDWPGELNKLSTSINDAAGAVESMIHSIQGLSQEVAGSSQIVLGNSAMLKVKLN